MRRIAGIHRNIFILIGGMVLLVAACVFFEHLNLHTGGLQVVGEYSEGKDSEGLLSSLCFMDSDEDKNGRVRLLSSQDVADSLQNDETLKYIYEDNRGEPEQDIWFAFMPSELAEKTLVTWNDNGDSVVKLQLLRNGSVIQQVRKGGQLKIPDSGELCTFRFLNGKDETVEEGNVRFYCAGNTPSLYLDMESGSMAEVDEPKGDDEKVSEEAAYLVRLADGSIESEGRCSVKGRGHSTWTAPKRPYNLTFEGAVSLLGISASSKYCLLANYFDDSNLRDWTAKQIAADLNMGYTPQCTFVNVYLNGRYNGLYQLSQRVKADGGSITAAQSGSLGSAPEAVVDFDLRYSHKEKYIETIRKGGILYYPKDPSDETLSEIQDLYQNAEDAVFAENGVNPYTGIQVEDCVDLDSWAMMYVLQEFLVQWDAEMFSYYTCILPEDSHIYAAPLWDFDLTAGTQCTGNYAAVECHVGMIENRSDSWLYQLYHNNADFHRKVLNEYANEVRPLLQTYCESTIPQKACEIEASAIMNAVRWQYTTQPEEETAGYVNWLRDRMSFVDDYWTDPSSYCRLTLVFRWGTLWEYVKKGENLQYLPLISSSGRYGAESLTQECLGWNDEEGNLISVEQLAGGFIIDRDREFHQVMSDAFLAEHGGSNIDEGGSGSK